VARRASRAAPATSTHACPHRPLSVTRLLQVPSASNTANCALSTALSPDSALVTSKHRVKPVWHWRFAKASMCGLKALPMPMWRSRTAEATASLGCGSRGIRDCCRGRNGLSPRPLPLPGRAGMADPAVRLVHYVGTWYLPPASLQGASLGAAVHSAALLPGSTSKALVPRARITGRTASARGAKTTSRVADGA
jgi:hypothetical protein